MMDIQASTLVLTKLRAPVLRPRMVPRTRLVDRLTAEAGMRLLLVCAPAGYGKTTLLTEWSNRARQNGAAVAWYALDASDDDPRAFGSYLVASFLQILGTGSGLAQINQLLRSSSEVDLQHVALSIVNAVALSPQPCVLILDDYHLISSPAIHRAVGFLIDHLPENLCAAIGSRSNPPLPLARLRARGQLLEVRSDVLRFNGEDTARFLNDVMRLDLSPASITALETRTEGWIAGLQLAALTLGGLSDKETRISSFTGSHRYLVDYLLEEVFNQQPAETQTFLMSTAVLERMCAPLCTALSERALLEDAPVENYTHSQAVLEQMEQANLFLISLDDQGRWYRYHHLFRDFLLARLNHSQPELVDPLHRVACAWLAEHDSLREAAYHAFQTRDWEYAAAFVEQHGFTLLVHSEMAAIHEWCAAFPEEVIQKHPFLCIFQCWPLVFSFRTANRERIETRLHQADLAIAVLDDPVQAGILAEHAAVVRTFLAMAPDPAADARAQLARASEMRGHYPEGNSGQFSGMLVTAYAHLALHDAPAAQQDLEQARQLALRGSLYFGVVESTFHMARLAQSRGELRRAVELCRQGRVDAAGLFSRTLPGETTPAQLEHDLPAVGCLDIALGCVYLEQDRHAEAEQLLLHGLELIGLGMNPYYLLTACTALSRLYEVQRRPGEAENYLHMLESAWPDIAFCTRGLRLRQALRANPADLLTLENAARWSQEVSSLFTGALPPPGLGPLGAAEVYYLTQLAWVHVQIETGAGEQARRPLERQLELAESHGLMGRVIELSLLQAGLEAKANLPSLALVPLQRALRLAEPEGCLRSFDQGPALAHLLAELRRRGVCPQYIERILAAVSMSPSSVEPALPGKNTALPDELSARELEVLRLMARGAANQAIAEHLVITVGTVKSHINHILGKLGARNRTEAVALARKSGISLMD